MATYRAIQTISEVLIRLLRASYKRADAVDVELAFEVSQGDDFGPESRISAEGITLFLYRTTVNGSTRTPPGRRLPTGEVQRSKLPLDLHYLVTIWAKSTTTQHQIAGWVMRTLETNSVIPKGVLSGVNPDVFRPDETVELIPNDLTNEELFRIWDSIDEPYHLSIPYLVRNVRIEAKETLSDEGVVHRRIFEILQDGNERGNVARNSEK